MLQEHRNCVLFCLGRAQQVDILDLALLIKIALS